MIEKLDKLNNAVTVSGVPRGQRGWVALGGTSEGAAFSEKNGHIYVKMVKMVKFTVKTDKRAENLGRHSPKGGDRGASTICNVIFIIFW